MKKIFTTPSEIIPPTSDNIDGNLVVAKGDYIVKSGNLKYMAIELLGVGTFGQVFRCVSNEGDEVAIKIVKGFNKFYQYEMNGLRILKKIKEMGMTKHFVKFYDAFIFKQHLCVVLELLKENMYQIMKIFKFTGFGLFSVRNILRQLLSGIEQLQSLGITHCDMKPENILMANYYSETIKIIDFGASSSQAMATHYYVQSRYYRAPEVILGIPYNSVVDIWSLGCIAYELLIGMPLFSGKDNFDQIRKIHDFLPNGLPMFMLEFGSKTNEYFERKPNGFFYFSKSMVKFTYYDAVSKIRKKCGEGEETDLFIELLFQMLEPSYLERKNAYECLKHPFFEIEDDGIKNEYHSQRIFNKENTLNTGKGERKASLYDANTIDNPKDSILYRKGSLYDPSRENRQR